MKPGLNRSWGDGGGDAREHVIAEISFAKSFVACSCGHTMTSSSGNAGLEMVWNIHRGYVNVEAERVFDEQANDVELRAFFDKLDASPDGF